MSRSVSLLKWWLILIALTLAVPVAGGFDARSQLQRFGQQQEQQQPQRSAIKQPGHPLLSWSASRIEGKWIIGIDGDPIGKVEDVVGRRGDGRIHVVVAIGGFLGIGARHYPIPLEYLSLEADRLYIRTTEKAIASGYRYRKEDYEAIQPEDQPIGAVIMQERLAP